MNKTLIVISLIFAVQHAAIADTFDVGSGGGIRGHSKNTKEIATPKNIEKAVEYINGQIVEVGQAQMLQNQALTEGLIGALRELFVSSTTAQAAIEDAKRYGPQTRSHSEDDCNNLRTSIASAEGRTNAKTLKSDIVLWRKARLGRHSDIGSVKIELEGALDYIEEREKEDLLHNQVKTKEQIEKDVVLDEIVLDPIPLGAMGSEPSAMAKAIDKIKQYELDLSREALDDVRTYDEAPTISAANAPIIKDESNKNLYTNINGEMSEKSLMDFNVASRYSSDEWKLSLVGKHEVVYLHEMAQMMAMSLEQSRRQNELLSQLVKLTSHQHALAVQEGKRGAEVIELLSQ